MAGSDEEDGWDDFEEKSGDEASRAASPAKRGTKRGRDPDGDAGARGRTSTGKQLKRSLSRMASSPQTPRSKSRKASGGKPKAKAKAKAKPELKNCIMPCCDSVRYRKLRWCSLHRYSVDNMKAQAEEKGTVPTFEDGMADDATAIEMVQEWEEINPPGKKWKKGGPCMGQVLTALRTCTARRHNGQTEAHG